MAEDNGNGLDRRTEQYRMRMTILAGVCTAGILGLCAWFYQIDSDIKQIKTKYADDVPRLEAQQKENTAELKSRLDREDAKIEDLYRLFWRGSQRGGVDK